VQPIARVANPFHGDHVAARGGIERAQACVDCHVLCLGIWLPFFREHDGARPAPTLATPQLCAGISILCTALRTRECRKVGLSNKTDLLFKASMGLARVQETLSAGALKQEPTHTCGRRGPHLAAKTEASCPPVHQEVRVFCHSRSRRPWRRDGPVHRVRMNRRFVRVHEARCKLSQRREMNHDQSVLLKHRRLAVVTGCLPASVPATRRVPEQAPATAPDADACADGRNPDPLG
jgi:hypothetical protein